MTKQLESFEQFMQQHHSWTLVNKTEKLLSYQKVTEEKKGSCIIALILLLLMIIPGLLYLYFARKSGKVHQISVALKEDGSLSPSGDPEGMKLYNRFLQSQNIQQR